MKKCFLGQVFLITVSLQRQVMNLKCFQKIPYSTDSLLSRIIRCSNVNFGAELVEFILYRPDQSYYEFGLGQTSECRCPGDTCLMIQNFDKAKAKETFLLSFSSFHNLTSCEKRAQLVVYRSFLRSRTPQPSFAAHNFGTKGARAERKSPN